MFAVFGEVTTALTSSENITYLASINWKTLQAICKELKHFDEATHRLAVENKEALQLVVLYCLISNQRWQDDQTSKLSLTISCVWVRICKSSRFFTWQYFLYYIVVLTIHRLLWLINVNAIVGGTGKYVLKPNTSGKAAIWKKSIQW